MVEAGVINDYWFFIIISAIILITLSPFEFQQTSKMPPVPLYEWTSCPFWVLQMWTHLLDKSHEYEKLWIK